MTTGERIRQTRNHSNLTLSQLAANADLSKGFLSDVENGKRDLSVKNLLKIARALRVTVTWLVAEEEFTVCPRCNGCGSVLKGER